MKDLLKPWEVGAILRVDESTVRRWIKIGVLPAVLLPRTGKRRIYLVKRSTMKTLLNEKETVL